MASPLQRGLIRESRPARMHLALAGLLGLCSSALIVAQAVLLAHVIARAVMHHAALASLTTALAALAAVLCARALVAGALELSGRLGAIRVMSELRGRLVARVLVGTPERRPQGLRTGELAATAVQGVDSLESYFAGYLPQLVLASAVPLAVVAWAALLDPVSALIIALTVPVLMLFMVLIGKGAQAKARARWRALGLLGAHFLDVVQGLATLRAFGRERAQEDTLARVGERYRSETLATLRVAFLSALVLELCAMMGTALVAATIGIQLARSTLGLQAGLTVLLLAPELYAPLRALGAQFHASADATSAFERIRTTVEQERPGHGAGGTSGEAPAPDPARSPIRFERVGYRHAGRERPALEQIDLELAPGEITALLGASGAGKSTLARLLLGLGRPDTGRITCAGVDLRDIDPERWRGRVAWVPQRPTLFSATLAQNIALYAPLASPQEVRAAARAAGAERFIAALPEGLETRVGEAGRRLSAGQAQRVALARAFLADRPLLVLDEPSAHLDDASSRDLAPALERLGRERTTLLIAHDHRLASLATRVYELREGRLLAPTTGSGARGARVGAGEVGWQAPALALGEVAV
jgi:ATP-binding cassette, subfamily C, bacterial CydD